MAHLVGHITNRWWRRGQGETGYLGTVASGFHARFGDGWSLNLESFVVITLHSGTSISAMG